LTSSALVAPPVRGAQEPRICHLPPFDSSEQGEEAVQVARLAGLHLDPWEEFVLARSLRERNEKWAAFEVGLNVPRQNGKGAILEARQIAGLFVIRERLIIHSAHQFDTSLEAFRRLLALIEDTPDFDREVKRVSRAHGEEGIELMTGQRIRFRTRTKGGGRGFTGDCLILDEAMILPETAHGALLPTLSARPNPQVWYTGSAVDQMVHEHGLVLARIRERGMAGTDPALAYFEWSPDVPLSDAVLPDVAMDPAVWAQGNPGLGIRISEEHVAREQRSMDARTFAVERLGVGDWPDPLGEGMRRVSLDDWSALTDLGSEPEGQVCFTFDVSPDRSTASIGVAGYRVDGLRHVGVIEHGRGTEWLPQALAERVQSHGCVEPICDGTGPAASLIPDIEALGMSVRTVTASEHGRACGLFVDTVTQKALRHRAPPEMRAALKGAVTRPLGDAWAWSRKSSSVDISPLVAVTLALWGIVEGGNTSGGFEWD